MALEAVLATIEAQVAKALPAEVYQALKTEEAAVQTQAIPVVRDPELTFGFAEFAYTAIARRIVHWLFTRGIPIALAYKYVKDYATTVYACYQETAPLRRERDAKVAAAKRIYDRELQPLRAWYRQKESEIVNLRKQGKISTVEATKRMAEVSRHYRERHTEILRKYRQTVEAVEKAYDRPISDKFYSCFRARMYKVPETMPEKLPEKGTTPPKTPKRPPYDFTKLLPTDIIEVRAAFKQKGYSVRWDSKTRQAVITNPKTGRYIRFKGPIYNNVMYITVQQFQQLVEELEKPAPPPPPPPPMPPPPKTPPPPQIPAPPEIPPPPEIPAPPQITPPPTP